MTNEVSGEILDLNATIESITGLLRRLVARERIPRTRLDPGLARIQATPRQMQWLFVNLATRAYDTMLPASELIIATSNVLTSDIPTSNIGPYAQVELIVTRGRIEAGIAARDIIRRAGGLVSVQDANGHGGRVTILFPAFPQLGNF